MKLFARLVAGALSLALLAHPALAVPMGASAPPTAASVLGAGAAAALQDIGAPTSCPFILIASGQSNMEGYDSNGSKAVQSNILITDSTTSPTTLVPAAFGSAPLTVGWSGSAQISGATQAQAYNNMAVHFANNLRLSGMLPASRPIVVVPNWFAGESIGNWIGSGTSSTHWTQLVAELNVVEAAYPGCPVNHVIWDQGEADSYQAVPTAYNSQAAYGTAFATLIAQYRALTYNGQSIFPYNTTFSVQELGLFYGSNMYVRNDFLRTLQSGAYDPYIDLVSASAVMGTTGTAAVTESAQNPNLHFEGNFLVELGKRHFGSWLAGRMGGGFRRGNLTYFGSHRATPPSITVAASATYNLTYDDVQNGATVTLNTGSTLNLPPPAQFAGQAPSLTVVVLGTSALHEASAAIVQENTTSRFSTITLPGSSAPSYVYRVFLAGGAWTKETVSPRVGNIILNATTPTAGAQLGLNFASPYFAQYRLSTTPVGLPGATDGSLLVFTNITGASYLGSSASASSGTGGTGYVTGDVVTFAGGTFGTNGAATCTVVASAGVMTACNLTAIGAYTAFPGSVTQGSTTGAGAGGTFTLTKRANTDVIKVPGLPDQSSYSIGGTNQVVMLMSFNNFWTVVFDSSLTEKRQSGVTGSRPALGASDAGFMYLDTTLGKPVWWNGSAWKDATGATA